MAQQDSHKLAVSVLQQKKGLIVSDDKNFAKQVAYNVHNGASQRVYSICISHKTWIQIFYL